MPPQPLFASKARQRQVVHEEARQAAVLEATGTLPSVTDAVGPGLALPTSSVTTHPGCTMRMSVTTAFRRRRAPARIKEQPARGKCAGWLEKVRATNTHQNKMAPRIPLVPRQSRMALPQIPRRGDKAYATPGQHLPGCPACLSSHAKVAPLGNRGLTPWSGPTRSETSFHAFFTPVVSFLHSVPFSAAGAPGSGGVFPEFGKKAPVGGAEERRAAPLFQRKARTKAQSGGLPSRLQSKRQRVELPSITKLNFSRNFTFSFFELPPHQSHEYWLQHQQLICLLMKQLQ
ncbi:uncharacterized protein LOC123034446 [Varanus komodoensis]|uniref:uncharacterized protein LOC123034446 n=1 Tax=Varanus komodoensis TaxID=61221 RepID=UPI001CF79F7C|nr:uncharacterized protein LOC123034446 [Varanus komodoensis]